MGSTTTGGGWRAAAEAMTEALLAGLNPAQREAVTHEGGPLLILAGPGSGKTRTLVHRLAWLVLRGTSPFRVLAVTFTNKAAREMQARVEELIGPVARDMWVQTFHSACVRILRRDIDKIGYSRRFVVVDDDDSRALVKQVMKDLRLDETRMPLGAVRAAISRAKDELLGPEEAEQAAAHFREERAARVYREYQRRLREADSLDFDDLIRLTVFLFRERPDVLEAYRQRFEHILVDEYQDTNHAQYVLVSLLASGHRNLTVVGDPDQGIYGWRGATIRNIVEFESDFPDARVVKLEQNYRSTQPILDAASAVIAHNHRRKPKGLWSDKKDGVPPRVVEADSEQDEAHFVAREIQRLHRGLGGEEGVGGTGAAPVPLGEIAVLYRTHAQSRVLEEVFLQQGIPYYIVGGLKFYQRAEVKDLIAYLRLVANPGDRLSLRRVINVPRRGVGEVTLARFEAFLEQTGLDAVEGLRRAGEVPGLSARVAGDLARLGELLAGCAATAATLDPAEDKVVTEVTRAILDGTGYLDVLEREGTPEALGRAENLREFLSVTREFDRRWALLATRAGAGAPAGEGGVAGEAGESGQGGEPGVPVESGSGHAEADAEADGALALGPLPEFLAEVALVSDADTAPDAADAVALMTLHSAKGLEFDAVFIIGLEEGVLPHSRAMESASDVEEERRLFYVGVTRARRHLTLTYTRRRMLYGATMGGIASRFVQEIPADLVERVRPAWAGVVRSPAAPLGRRGLRWRPVAPDAFDGVDEVDEVDPAGPGSGGHPAPPPKPSRLQVGDKVRHKYWGTGTVRGVRPTEDDTEVDIEFPRYGLKTVLLSYAPIEPV